MTFFGGNDYHRLSRHPDVLGTLAQAAKSCGLSTAGSRATTGNHPAFRELEERAADYLGCEQVAICSAGYLSASIAVQALSGAFTHILLDENAHPSLGDAARQTGAELLRYSHADADALAAALHARPGGRPLIATDGVFANTGRMPPLAAYAELTVRHRGWLLVDDAHGAGAVGATGKGSWEEAGIGRDRLIQTGTFSKAFGGFGGFVAASAELIAAAISRSGAFIGSTPAPIPVACCTRKAIEILRDEPQRISRLRALTLRCKGALREWGFAVSEGPAPICSVTFGDERRNAALRRALRDRDIYPSFINYPGCPPGGHFRFTMSSAHSDEQVAALMEAVGEAVERAGRVEEHR